LTGCESASGCDTQLALDAAILPLPYFHIYGFMGGMKTTLDIPDALYREVKMRAARDGVKIKDVVVKSIADHLHPQATAPKQSVKKKSIFPFFHGPGGPLLQNKDLRSLSFLDEQDDLERYQRAFRR
jgi:hypothetical protein